MPPDIELAIGKYLEGDPLGCAHILARMLQRPRAWEMLLLLAALEDLDMTELVAAIRDPMIDGILRVAPADSELVAAFRVTTGLQEPCRDLDFYRDPAAPVLAFWAARRLAHHGDEEASLALMKFTMTHSEHLESALARHFVVSGNPALVAASDVQRAQLTVQILLKIGHAPLRDRGFVETLLSAEDPGARLEGAIAHATLSYGEARAHLPALLGAHRDGITAASTEALTQAAFLLIIAEPPWTEAEALVGELLDQLASRKADQRLAEAAQALALAAAGKPGQKHRDKVLDFVVESGVLAAADEDGLALLADFIKQFGGRRELESLDDACAARPDLSAEIYLAAALAAHRHSESDSPTLRLCRAAKRLCSADDFPNEPALPGSLTRTLFEAKELDLAGRVACRALQEVGFQVTDEVWLWFARNGATCLALAGDGEGALQLLTRCLQETTANLDRRDDLRTHLLLMLMQVAHYLGKLEDTIPYLYELRYRVQTEEPVDPDQLAKSLRDIGTIFEFVGSFGTAQRYQQDVLTRPECSKASEEMLQEMGKRLARTQVRAFGGTDEEYAELTGGNKARDEVAKEETSSPLAPMVELTRRRVKAHLDADPAAVLAFRKQASDYLDDSSLEGSLLHSAIQQSLAVDLAHSGDYESASRLARSSLRALSHHAAELAAVGPVEDFREICATLARGAGVALNFAERAASRAVKQETLEVFLTLRSLWADLRMIRREAGGDAASPRRGEIAATRRRLARLLLDGPKPQAAEINEFFESIFQARLERDLTEIASIHGRLPAGAAAERLEAAFDASIAALGPDAAFVGYFKVATPPTSFPALTGKVISDGEHYVAVVLRNGTYTAVRLGEVEEIDTRAEELQDRLRAEALAPRGAPPSPDIAEALASALADPILGLAGDAAMIHLTADGDLSDLPWRLVFGSRGLDPHRIRVVQSFLSLGRKRVQSVRLDPGALIITRPDYGDPAIQPSYVDGISRFEDLPTTAVEGEVVAEACRTEAVQGKDAAPRVLLGAAPVGVLHVASHGYLLRGEMSPGESEQGFDQLGSDMFIAREETLPGPLTALRLKDPLLHSGIAMGGVNDWLADDGRDAPHTGVVTAEDLSWCDLSEVDCVVLSACSSGRGEGSSTLGSRGMRFAALAAGASWIIASLWPVPDVASAILMEWLYEGFAAGMAPPNALVEAQNRLREADPVSISASATARKLLAAPPETMARRYLEELQRSPRTEAPFAHPYFWCGFVCSS